MGLNHERLAKRREARGGGQGWSPADGENQIRILPPLSRYLTNWDEMDDVALKYKMHWLRVEGRQVETTRCLEDLGQKCPVCAVWRAHRKSTDPGLAQQAKAVAPSDRYLINLIDLRNIAAGIQHWDANWSCWDKIMEIAANTQWGNVLDPERGFNFKITKTPADKTRSGYPAYDVDVLPVAGSAPPRYEPTSIQAILASIEGWEGALDTLEEQKRAPKEVSEIQSLLDEIGFPSLGTPVSPRPSIGVSAAPAPAPAVPAPAVTPAPAAPAVAVQPIPAAPAPAPQAAAPAAPAPVAPPVAAAAPAAPAAPTGEKPVCFGEYSPQIHPCSSCPEQVDCQLKMLGIK